MACLLTNDLRDAVLQYALEGCLTRTLNSDTPVNNTIELYKQEKESILTSKNMKDRNSFSDINNDEILFNIPETWSWIRINDIGVYKKGPFGSALTKSMFVKKDVNTVKVYEQKNAIQKDATLGSYYITEEYYNKKMKGFSVVPGDIIVSCAGTIGEIYIVPEGSEMGIINQALMRMNIVPSVNIDYFMLVFNHILKEEARKNSGGTAIKNIPPFEVFKAMPIPIPPIEEQARIVAKVDEIMAKIDEYEKLENQLVKLKEQFPQDMKDSLLQAGMMGKLTEQYHSEHSPLRNLKNDTSEYDSDLPSNWSVAKMMTVSELYTGNSISESIKKSKYTGLSSGYNYIGTKDVGFDCSIAYNNGVKIPYDEPKFKIAKKHSTLLCIEGGSAGKKVGITSEDVCFGNKLCSFNAREYINYKFQFYVIQSPTFKKVFIQNKSGMIGGVSIKKLKEILIPLPPIEEQQRIVDKLDELLPLVDKLAELN